MTLQADPLVSRSIGVHDVAWEDVAPGLKSKPLWADPSTGRRAYMGRIDGGVQLPPHRHLGDELVYVVEGEVTDESGALLAGQASYRPDGCVHTLSSRRGTTVLIVVTGTMEPVAGAVSGPRSIPIDISLIDWVDAAPGVREKLIWEDPGTRRSMRLVRLEPGAALPTHRHAGDAIVFGIEGEITDELGTTLPGYLTYRSDRCAHSVRTKNGATVLYYGWGTTERLDS